MEKNEIAIDIGYSSCKIAYMDKIVKFPTSISYATDVGITYGEDNVYEFEGEKYYVGKDAVDGESFTTNEYKFLHKFAPLLIYHILSKFDQANLDEPLVVKTGLAMVDWHKKDDFIERISEFEVNGQSVEVIPKLIPQGAGCIMDWVNNDNAGDFPHKIMTIDLGYNTINVVGFTDGKPMRKDIKSYPGHGVSSIIKPFTSYLENTYAMNFSEQEAISIFVRGSFKYNGEEQPDLSDKILELKSQFVKKLFQSVLVNDKKSMATSDVVLIAGGGAYLLQDTPFPPNVEFVSEPFEFSNVRGYSDN
jgi:hypothetical protein